MNTIGYETLPKTIQNEINSKGLQFLKKYTKFYIEKYLEFYEKSNDANYSFDYLCSKIEHSPKHESFDFFITSYYYNKF